MTHTLAHEVTGRQVIRVRGIILHDEKLLVVRHAHNPSFAALPGGHLEFGEDLQSGLHRELVEELGVKPVIGPLLYVNTFITERNKETLQVLEFFFAIANAADYVKLKETPQRSHAHELAAVEWLSADAVETLRPAQLQTDFAAGILSTPGVRYIIS